MSLRRSPRLANKSNTAVLETKCKICKAKKNPSAMRDEYCIQCLRSAVCPRCDHTIGEAHKHEHECIICKKCNAVFHGDIDGMRSCYAMLGGCCAGCIECDGEKIASQPPWKDYKVFCNTCWDEYSCNGCGSNIHQPHQYEFDEYDEERNDDPATDNEPMLCNGCNRAYHALCYHESTGGAMDNCCG